MKLLVDACVRDALIAAGHDVLSTVDLGPDPGDAQLLALATEQARAVITMDKDFGELAVSAVHEHCGILRLQRVPASLQAAMCVAAVEKYEQELADAGIVTVSVDRVRVRPRDDASQGPADPPTDDNT